MKIAWTPEFLRKLEMLGIVSKRMFAGRMKGERRSPRKGASVEFADFRNYVQGDDHRHIDWNAYARFESLFLKLFMEEEDLHVAILIDASASMSFGGKIEMAARTAAALGYIALANLDRVSIEAFSGSVSTRLPPTFGKTQVSKVLAFLENIQPAGPNDLERRIREFVDRTSRGGLAVLISDFMDEGGFEKPLNLLHYNHFETVAVQILSREEVDPPVGGDWRFVDSETRSTVDLSLGPRAVKKYKARLQAYTEGLEAFCRGRSIACIRATADQDFEELVLKYFRESALIS